MFNTTFGQNHNRKSSRSNLCILTSKSNNNLPLTSGNFSDDGRRFALKTNLLYLCTGLLNIEGEYFFNDRWSGNLEFQGAWWSSKPSFFYRVVAASPEVRFWFGRKARFHGHFLGVFVGAGLYELMFKPSFGVQGEFYIAGGLSYGYAMPIGRRLHLEFCVGVGFMTTDYRQYHFDAGCYVYEQTKRYSYLGPMKAKISLVVPLGGKVKKNSGR